LRTKGAQNGAILALAPGQQVTQALKEQAIAAALGAPSMAGLDLAQQVTPWLRLMSVTQTEWVLGTGYGEQAAPKFHVVAYDFGVKKNILCACWPSAVASRPWCLPKRRLPRCSSTEPDGIFCPMVRRSATSDYAIGCGRDLD
jgi:carbamoylphosphate synthase small subunit